MLFPGRRIWRLTNREPPRPLPSTPIAHSSLVRHPSVTYSTKCLITSPGLNKCDDIFNRARLHSTTLYQRMFPSSLISSEGQWRVKVCRWMETLQCPKIPKKRERKKKSRTRCCQTVPDVAGRYQTRSTDGKMQRVFTGETKLLLLIQIADFIEKIGIRIYYNLWCDTHKIQ